MQKLFSLAAPVFFLSLGAQAACVAPGGFAYDWAWCTKNSGKDPTVKSTCFGSLSFGLHVTYRAIQIEEAGPADSSTFECLFSGNSGEKSSLPGCNSALEKRYTSLANSGQTTLVKECQQGGFVTWISGTTLSGNKFESHP